MEPMVQEFETLIKKMRRDAVYKRWDGNCVQADLLESLALDIERVLAKHTDVPIAGGYPCLGGWWVSSPTRYIFGHMR